MKDSRPQRRSTGAANSTRNDLLQATIDVIQRDGVGAATSRAVADAAGVNLGAITYYFGSKDTLVAEALAETGRRLLAPVIDALTEAASPLTQLQRAVVLLPEILGDNPEELRGYVQALAAAVDDASVRAALTALHREVADLLAAQIGTHQTAGLVPAWVHPREMAATIIALVDGVAMTTAAGLACDSPTAIGTEFASLLMRAAATPLIH